MTPVSDVDPESSAGTGKSGYSGVVPMVGRRQVRVPTRKAYSSQYEIDAVWKEEDI
jgi:hypothetical protein